MGIEQTLILVKPDALKKGMEFEVLDRIRDAGFSFPLMYKTGASLNVLNEHYANVFERYGPEKGGWTLKSMMDGPLIAAVAEGENASAAVREIAGNHFDPQKCASGTIRKDFSDDSLAEADRQERGIYNVIHTSDSKDTAKREIYLWFDKYLPSYMKNRKDAVYQRIAEAIGHHYPDLIRSTAEVSNERKIIYHGIKAGKNSARALTEGIRPMSPEFGGCSFWATGKNIFLPLDDSVLFNYSGGYNGNKSIECSIAMTDFRTLSQNGISLPEFRADSQFTFNETINLGLFVLLKVKVANIKDNNHVKLRKERQEIEKILLRGIDYQIFGNFTPGHSVTYEK